MTAAIINAKVFQYLMGSARVAALLMVLGIYFSTALISLSEIIILFCWVLLLLSGNVKEQLRTSFYLPEVKVGLALLVLMLSGLIISADVTTFKQVGQYRELLLLPLLLFILNNQTWKKIIYYSFLGGMVVALMHSYLQFFALVPNSLDEPNTSTIGRIAGAIMLAFACYAFLEEALRNKNTRVFWAWLGLFLVGSFALLFLYNGRTGLLVYFAILFIWGFRFLGKKGVVITTLLISMISFSVYHTSPSVKDRVDATKNQLQSLINTDVSTTETDLTRVGLYFRTINLMRNHDTSRIILGGGAGSLKAEAKENQYIVTNPHNEYLLIFFENGVFGLILLLAFFILTWSQANKINEHEKWLLRALVITISVGCLFNSLLLDNKEAHFYVLLLATLVPVAKVKSLPSNG